jgi:hypothetical protein
MKRIPASLGMMKRSFENAGTADSSFEKSVKHISPSLSGEVAEYGSKGRYVLVFARLR